MKLLFGITFFFVLISALQNVSAQPFADIQFERMDYNFGKIKEENGPANFNFNFTSSKKTRKIISV